MSNRVSPADCASRPRLVAAKLAELEAKAGGTAVITLGAEASNAIVATIQLKQPSAPAGSLAGVAATSVAAAVPVFVWISDTAGAIPSGTAPNGAVSITVGVLLATITTKVLHLVVATAAGQVAISIGETTAKSFYLNVSHAGVITSKIVTFA